MSEASSLAGRKRERSPRTRNVADAGAWPTGSPIEPLDAVRKACRELGGRPYGLALNELANALQQIFSAQLVVIRDSTPGGPLGVAPTGTDPRCLDAMDERGLESASSPYSFLVPAEDASPSASGIEQFVVVPIEQPRGPGSVWLGFAGTRVLSADDLTCFALLGEVVGFTLWRLALEASYDDVDSTVASPDLTTGQIVSIAAHELRTPLTPITMLLQALERKARAGNLDIEAIVRTRRQVNRLAQMISDLLDLTRLREGRLVLTPVLLELGTCLTQAVNSFRDADAKRRVEFTMTGEPMVILSDEQRFFQTVSSLLDHVARLTPTDGIIQVNLERRADRAALTITAQGPQAQPDVVSGAHLGTSRAHPFSLAIMIAQAVLMRSGGTITLRSSHEGNAGIEATFQLSVSDKG
jgi:His Kinase A (phospho-acceptor) domain/Histidine kinase-, DNA gyrase B-, and HSP90-like ATPase